MWSGTWYYSLFRGISFLIKYIKNIIKINPLIFVLIILFILLNIGDVITTYYILPGESNPLYLLTGSLFWVFLLKIFLIGTIIYIYIKNKFKSHIWYYTYNLVLVFGILLLTLAVINNGRAIGKEEIIKNASEVPKSDKIFVYSLLMLFLYLIPAIINIVIFIIYDKTVHKVNFEKEVEKNDWQCRRY